MAVQTDFQVIVCLNVMRWICSPVLCGRVVVSSLVDDGEISATPSSASLSFLPGSSGRHFSLSDVSAIRTTILSTRQQLRSVYEKQISQCGV